MVFSDKDIAHLLRRAGFGATPQDFETFSGMPLREMVQSLLRYEDVSDDVDAKIGKPGYLGVTSRSGQPFDPNGYINDARQRWLFRMVHSERPLQEKMTLFWHNHFATAFSKVAGIVSAAEPTRVLAAKPSEDPAKIRGQIELFRDYALGNFRDLLIEVARDPAMLVWLDVRSNIKARPQENFARELMELFTMGVGLFAESDVYAAARVFTGWNMRRVGGPGVQAGYYEFFYNAAQHDTGPKEFTFAIYPDGGATIPPRAAGAGMQDGIDLITALARHPETARRLARKFYAFFVSETSDPDPRFIDDLATTYLQSGSAIRPVIRRLLTSPQFWDPSAYFARYSWPVEFVVRLIREVGWNGFSAADTLSPLIGMGQQLFEPPDVNGWDLGEGWFSSGAMLARMNFASTLARNQRFNLLSAARAYAATPESVLAYMLDRLSPAPFDDVPYEDLLAYARANGPWTGSDSQVTAKLAGLVHLIGGAGEYQFV